LIYEKLVDPGSGDVIFAAKSSQYIKQTYVCIKSLPVAGDPRLLRPITSAV